MHHNDGTPIYLLIRAQTIPVQSDHVTAAAMALASAIVALRVRAWFKTSPLHQMRFCRPAVTIASRNCSNAFGALGAALVERQALDEAQVRAVWDAAA
jgi:hypothetical protein